MHRFYLAAAGLAALAACDQPSGASTQLANPAATYCIDSGGKYEIQDGTDGQTGLCTLADGRQVDAWEYFRENHTN
ncbi:DUF333 domain-containing protein [Ruegeria sp.]|uniref:putative hemolysin n=1 Tax=Ruegeria sp. TaxID=1879320 RepID=UPI0023086BBA|nr:DUF333 domain-containing protein [Ruegeria sp.]MDA7967089.1 DUF333 domain-containing protein [Ruegeria sp.]